MAQNENSKKPAYIEYDPNSQTFCGRCRSMVPINSPHECVSFGMPQESPTLRDQFAMAALTGLFCDEEEYNFNRISSKAYRMADAMLVARRNPPK